MKLIVITSASIEKGEDSFLHTLFDAGIDFLHLRKPEAGIDSCRRLLEKLNEDERKKIIVHDYHDLYDEFSLKGVHINKNIIKVNEGYQGFKTRSCHSLEEVQTYKKDFDYMFLSPIFDSISKEGYSSKFSIKTLKDAAKNKIIDEKTVALGGINSNNIPILKELNFGGCALLGHVYNLIKLPRNEQSSAIKHLLALCS